MEDQFQTGVTFAGDRQDSSGSSSGTHYVTSDFNGNYTSDDNNKYDPTAPPASAFTKVTDFFGEGKDSKPGQKKH